jgi:hypothetical protein
VSYPTQWKNIAVAGAALIGAVATAYPQAPETLKAQIVAGIVVVAVTYILTDRILAIVRAWRGTPGG